MKTQNLIYLFLIVLLSPMQQVFAQGTTSTSKTPVAKQTTGKAQTEEISLPAHQLTFVPVTAWKQVLERHPNGFLVQYKELKKLWKETLQQAKQNQKPKRIGSIKLLSLTMKGKVKKDSQQAKLSIEIKLHSFQNRWQKIYLPFQGLGFTKASITGAKGVLSPHLRLSGSWLFVKAKGTFTLSLKAGVAVHKTNRGAWLKFQLPNAPISNCQLLFSGKQEIKSSQSSWIARHFAEKTILSGGLQSQQIHIFFRPLEVITQKTTRLTSHVHTHYFLRKNIQRIHSNILFKLYMGKEKSFKVRVPKGFQLYKASAPGLTRYGMDSKAGIFWFTLSKEPSKNSFRLSLDLLRSKNVKTMSLKGLQVIGSKEETGKISIWPDSSVQLRIQKIQKLTRVEAEHCPKLQSGPFKNHTQHKKVTGIAFSYWHSSHLSEISIMQVLPRLQVEQSLHLSLQKRLSKAVARLKVTVLAGQKYQLTLQIPYKWSVQKVLSNQQRLQFWIEKKLLKVDLKNKLEAGKTQLITLHLTRTFPLPKSGSKKLDLPSIRVIGASREFGRYRVSLSPFYQTEPESFSNLQSKAGVQRRWEIIGTPYSGILKITRKNPILKVVTVSRYRVQRDILRTQVDAHIQVTGSGLRNIQFAFPAQVSEQVSFTGVQARIIGKKRFTKEGRVRWLLQFEKEKTGKFGVIIRFSQRIGSKKKALVLPFVRGVKTAFETGFIGIEAQAGMELSHKGKDLRLVDVSEIPEALGKRKHNKLLFAFRRTKSESALTLLLQKHSNQATLTAVVRKLSLLAQVSPQGSSYITANYQFKDLGLSYFEVTLPKNAEFWSARLNGKGIKPFIQENRLKVALPSKQSRKIRTIQITYLLQSNSLKSKRYLKTQAPKVDYPIQATSWKLQFPKSHILIHANSKNRVKSYHRQKGLLLLLLNELSKAPQLLLLFGVIALLFLTKKWIWLFLLWFIRLLFASKWRLIAVGGAGLLLFVIAPLSLKQMKPSATNKMATPQEEQELRQVPQRFSKIIIAKKKRTYRKGKVSKKRKMEGIFFKKDRSIKNIARPIEKKLALGRNQRVRPSAPLKAAPQAPPPPRPQEPRQAAPPPPTPSIVSSPSSNRPAMPNPSFYRKKSLDRDQDGIIDKRDRCPNTPGIKRHRGCPGSLLLHKAFNEIEKSKEKTEMEEDSIKTEHKMIAAKPATKISEQKPMVDQKEKQKPKQAKEKWRLPVLGSRRVEGIRSMNIDWTQTGTTLYSHGPGSNPSVTVRIREHSSHMTLLILFALFCAGLLFIVGRFLPEHHLALFLLGVFICTLLSINAEPQTIQLSNAGLLGFLLTGLLEFLFKSKKKQATTALLLLCFFLPLPAKANSPRPQAQIAKQTTLTSKEFSHLHLKPFASHQFFAPYHTKESTHKSAKQIYISKRWYQQLQAIKHEKKQQAPLRHQIVHASYSGVIGEKGVVSFQAQLQIEVMKPGKHLLNLHLSGSLLQMAQMDGKATTVFAGPNGYTILLEKVGSHNLKLHFTLETRQTRKISLHLPKASSGVLRLEKKGTSWQFELPHLPGGYTQKVAQGKSTLLAALGQTSQVKAKWFPKIPRQQATHSSLQVKVQIHALIQKHLFRVIAEYQFTQSSGKTKQFAFELPMGTSVESLKGSKIRGWRVERIRKKRFLFVLLEAPVKSYKLKLQTVQLRRKATATLQAPLPIPLGVSRYTGKIGFKSTSDLLLHILKNDGAEKSEKNGAQFTRKRIGQIPNVLHAVYQFHRKPSFQLKLWVSKTKIKAVAKTSVRILNTRLSLTHKTTYSAQTERGLKRNKKLQIFELWFLVSPNLNILSVKSAQSSQAKATIKSYWWAGKQKGLKILRIELTRSIKSGYALQVNAEQKLNSNSSKLPALIPWKVDQLFGEIALIARKNLEVRVTHTQGLDQENIERYRYKKRQLNQDEHFALAFSYTRSGYKGKLSWKAKRVVQTAKQVSHMEVQADSLYLSTRIDFRTESTAAEFFRFSVPKSLANAISFPKRVNQKGRNSYRISKKSSAGDRIDFLIQSASLRSQFSITFTATLTMPSEGKFSLPQIYPERCESYTAYFSVGKVGQIRIKTSPQKSKNVQQISVTRFPFFPPKVNRKAIFIAYRLKKPNWNLSYLREELKTEISTKPSIDLAQLESVLSANRESWHLATYQVRTPGLQYLQVQLPQKAHLWSVIVNNQPVRPARKGKQNSILLPLPPKYASDLSYTVRILYSMKIPKLELLQTLQPLAPKVLGLSISESYWSIYIPKGYRLLYQDGNMEPSTKTLLSSAKLEKAIGFYRRLTSIRENTRGAEQARASDNMIQQMSKIKGYLGDAIRTQRLDEGLAQKKSINGRRRSRVISNRGRLRQLQSVTSSLSRQTGQIKNQKLASDLRSDKNIDDIVISKRGYSDIKQTMTSHGRSQTREQKTLAISLIRSGTPFHFSLVGGSPKIKLHLYSTQILPEAIRWLLIALGFLLFLWWFRKQRNKKSS